MRRGARSRDEGVAMAAHGWVIGRVGCVGHEHLRGDAHVADLTLEPVEGARRVTGVDLFEVDRTLPGTAVASAPS